MGPLTPLGKPLSQLPLGGADVPASSAPQSTDAPISAFQWVSLAKATWTWVLRPLWYLCFKWPSQLLFAGTSASARTNGGRDWRKEHQRQMEEDRRADWRRNTSNDHVPEFVSERVRERTD